MWCSATGTMLACEGIDGGDGRTGMLAGRIAVTGPRPGRAGTCCGGGAEVSEAGGGGGGGTGVFGSMFTAVAAPFTQS